MAKKSVVKFEKWLVDQGFDVAEKDDDEDEDEDEESEASVTLDVPAVLLFSEAHRLVSLLQKKGVNDNILDEGIQASYHPMDGTSYIDITGIYEDQSFLRK